MISLGLQSVLYTPRACALCGVRRTQHLGIGADYTFQYLQACKSQSTRACRSANPQTLLQRHSQARRTNVQLQQMQRAKWPANNSLFLGAENMANITLCQQATHATTSQHCIRSSPAVVWLHQHPHVVVSRNASKQILLSICVPQQQLMPPGFLQYFGNRYSSPAKNRPVPRTTPTSTTNSTRLMMAFRPTGQPGWCIQRCRSGSRGGAGQPCRQQTAGQQSR